MSSTAIPPTQTRIVLNYRPKDEIDTSYGNATSTFRIEKDARVPSNEKELKEGEVLVKVEYISLDPAMRGWLRDVRSYLPPVGINEVMRASGLGEVVLSTFPDLQPGDKVQAPVGWQQWAVLKGKDCVKRIPPPQLSLLDYLGPLGMVGQTAYWGLFDVGQVKPGDTVVVSGAAGAVGSYVVQMAKIKEARVIALAGSAEKCAWLTSSLGADVALNYKDADFKAQFRKAVGYLDVYFDNVGGETLDLALTCLKQGARIALCGAISDYNKSQLSGIKNYQTLIGMRGRMQGFIVFDYRDRYHEAEAQMAKWIVEGKMQRKFDVREGIERCPEYLTGLFSGSNTGKLVVKV